MAKMPGWIRVSDVQHGPEGISMTVGVRPWHPGFVLHVLGQMRHHVDLRVHIGGRDRRLPWFVLAPALLPFVAWSVRHAWRHRVPRSEAR